MGWFWGAVLKISAVTATFLGFYPVFGLNFGSCFKDLVITAPQGLPTMLSTYGYYTLFQFSPT